MSAADSKCRKRPPGLLARHRHLGAPVSCAIGRNTLTSRPEPVSSHADENIPLYRNSVFAYMSPHPGSSLRGDLVVVTFASRACGGRGSVRVREEWAGRIALREPKASFRRAALLGFVSSVSFRLRRQGWEYCGEMADRAYGKTVWSWPSLLRSSLGGGGSRVNRRDAGGFRWGEGGQKELGSRESTA